MAQLGAEVPRRAFIDKEKDGENGLGDFGVRKYEEETGRFLSVDALWEKYRSLTPYQYGSENPLNSKDPTGMVLAMPEMQPTPDINGSVEGSVLAPVPDPKPTKTSGSKLRKGTSPKALAAKAAGILGQVVGGFALGALAEKAASIALPDAVHVSMSADAGLAVAGTASVTRTYFLAGPQSWLFADTYTVGAGPGAGLAAGASTGVSYALGGSESLTVASVQGRSYSAQVSGELNGSMSVTPTAGGDVVSFQTGVGLGGSASATVNNSTLLQIRPFF